MSGGYRPSDWSPLAGADPCPGDPGHAADLAHWWYSLASRLQYAGGRLGATQPEGEGNSVERLKVAMREEVQILASAHDQFVRAGDLISDWSRKLADWQAQSEAKLRSAQDKQDRINELNQLIPQERARSLNPDAHPAPFQQLLSPDLDAFYAQRHSEELFQLTNELARLKSDVEDIAQQYRSEADAKASRYWVEIPAGFEQVAGRSALGSGSGVAGFLVGSDVDFVAVEDALKHTDTYEGSLRLLTLLAQLSPVGFAVLSTSNPDFGIRPLTFLTAKGSAQHDVVRLAQWVTPWWDTLSPEQRQLLMQNIPGVIGNLNGVTYGDRDTANRFLLKDLDEKRDTLSDDERQSIDQIKKSLGVKGLNYFAVKDEKRLASFMLPGSYSGKVLASVSTGDMDSASNVGVIIPGMNTWTSNAMADLTQNATYLNKQLQRDIQKFKLGRDRSSATLALLGYDAPTPLQESVSLYADNGAYLLARTLDGFQAYRQSSVAVTGKGLVPSVGVVAHSFGTDAGSRALTLAEIPVSSVTLLASPGIQDDISHATQLNVAWKDGTPNVYASQANADPWARLGQQTTLNHRVLPVEQVSEAPKKVFGHVTLQNVHRGPDGLWYGPNKEVFGAHVFTSDGGTVLSGPDAGRSYPAVGAHDLTMAGANQWGYLEIEDHNGEPVPSSGLYNTSLNILNLGNEVTWAK